MAKTSGTKKRVSGARQIRDRGEVAVVFGLPVAVHGDLRRAAAESGRTMRDIVLQATVRDVQAILDGADKLCDTK